MSWQEHIKNLMSYGCFTDVGIFSVADGSVWASTDNFPIANDQIKVIIRGISNPTDVAQTGVKIRTKNGEEKYLFVKTEGNSVLFKKATCGIVAQKATQCILIGVHDEKVKAEAVLVTISRLVDHLVKYGY